MTFLLTTAVLPAKEYKLRPRTFRDTSNIVSPNLIPWNFFSYEKYINASDSKVIWLESDLPETDEPLSVIVFNREVLLKADVYLLQKDNSWMFIGRTGISYFLDNRSEGRIKTTPAWEQAVVFPSDISCAHPRKIRVRMEPQKYAAISLSFSSLSDYEHKMSVLTFWCSIIIGIFLCASLVIFMGAIFFKSNFYLYVSGITLALTGHILSVQGFGTIYLWPWLIPSGKAENMVFMFSLAALFCATGALFSDNRQILPGKHPSQIINTVFFVCMILSTVQFLILDQNAVQPILTLLIIITMCVFFYICIKVSVTRASSDRHMYQAWSAAVLLIIIRQIFHIARGKWDVGLFRIFDNDIDWPVCAAIVIITIPTMINIIIRLRGKIALLEIETAAALENTQTANSRSFAYSRVVFSLMAPMTVLVNSISSPLSGVSDQTRNIVQKSCRIMKRLLNVLFSLSHYESGIAEIDENNEPVILLPFMMNAVEEQLKDIRLKGNLPEIKRGMSPLTAVLADKTLLEVFFEYMLEPVRQFASAGTPVLIYIDYKNSVLTYSVHITSSPLGEQDARNILDLDFLKSQDNSGSKNQFNKIISTWGIQLHIVKRIVTLYKGSMAIHPDPLGNTFVAQFVLKPASAAELGTEAVKNEHKTADELRRDDANHISARRQHALYGETILVVEGNTDLRTTLTDMFSQFYKTIHSVNGQEALALLKNFVPDMVLTSDTLPVMNCEELLKFCQKDTRLCTVPFFVMTSFSETQRRLAFYRLGVVEVIEKPFLPEELLAKVNSFMDNRRTVKTLVLADISNVVRQGMIPQSYDQGAVLPPQGEQTHREHSFGAADRAQKTGQTLKSTRIPSSAQMALFTAANLSGREIQIAMFISQGLSDKEIAAQLDISPATVAVHNKKIFKKLDIHSRLELMNKTM
jgi:Response regulator containing a CheY-like receiver domain and an HTH DNA-binding domain